ncbi:MAG: FAD binding domain-containing protein [Prosthecobacter sp.]|nr:FAD binding domain-containing protein [Prosthecobacter sp.]
MMEAAEQKTYLIPTSVDEALKMATDNFGAFRYLAGGTDVMVNSFQGNGGAPCLIDITAIQELKGVRTEGDRLRISALHRLEDLKYVETLQREFPMLIEAALHVGAPLLRKTATLGGNVLCENRCLFYNQSEWWREAVGHCLKCEGDICIATQGKKACFSELVSDTAPALIAMCAEIEVADTDGIRRMKLEDIYTGDGVRPRNLSPTAILTAILLPLRRGFRTSFRKLRERQSLDFTSLTTAVSVDSAQHLRIVLAGVDPRPVLVLGMAGDDRSMLIRRAITGARTVDNDMYSRGYRRDMIQVFLDRSLEELLNDN